MYTNWTCGGLSIRELVPSDIDAMAAMFADPKMDYEMAHLLGATPAEQAARYIGSGITQQTASPRMAFMQAIEDKDGFAGTTILTKESKLVDGADNIGWIVGPQQRGRGYALRSTALLLHGAILAGRTDFAAVMSVENIASRRITERLGLQMVGITELNHPTLRAADGGPKKALLCRGTVKQVRPAVRKILGC